MQTLQALIGRCTHCVPVVICPTHTLAANNEQLCFSRFCLECEHRLVRQLPPHWEDDRAILQRRGKASNKGKHLRTPRRELRRFMIVSDASHHKSRLPRVTRVEDAPEFVTLMCDERLGFINVRRVGDHSSMLRNTAATVVFDVGSGSLTACAIRPINVVLPHLFTIEVIPRLGDTSATSATYVNIAKSVAATAPPSGRTR